MTNGFTAVHYEKLAIIGAAVVIIRHVFRYDTSLYQVKNVLVPDFENRLSFDNTCRRLFEAALCSQNHTQ
jgi:hypothetical protein